jgi:hypothetical protein
MDKIATVLINIEMYIKSWREIYLILIRGYRMGVVNYTYLIPSS